MKILNKILNLIGPIGLQPVLSILLGLLLFITSCNNKPEPYSILEFKGNYSAKNFSKQNQMTGIFGDSSNQSALIASIGDLIIFDDETMFCYRNSFQNKFYLKKINGVSYINDKIISITVPEDDEMIPWFNQLKPADLSELQFLNIPSKLKESYIPYLRDVAKNKPDISLGSSGENLNDLKKLFEFFNPRFLIEVTISQKDYKLLSGFNNLELLLATLGDSVITIPLPAIPQLKQLIVEMGSVSMLNKNFLLNNTQLEKLIILNQRTFDFSLIEPLENLRELTIFGYDTILNFDKIGTHKHLELLSIAEGDFKFTRELNELKGIRWMSFSPEATQDEFNTFIDYHPNIEVLELYNDKEKINNLESIKKLKNIYGLTLKDTVTDIATIKTLKNLKFLSLPESVLKDSLLKTELKKLLSSTIIVANEGVCLGSGWFLLIIPLILFFVIVTRKKPVEIEKIK